VKPTRIYVIGDSISIQYGPYLQQYLSDRFHSARKEGEQEALLRQQELLNLDRPQGANGGDSSMVLAYLQALFARGGLEADLLLINCGLHDIKREVTTHALQVPLDRYEANLRDILAQAQRLAIRTIWVRTTPVIDERHNRLNTTFQRFEADVEADNAAADRVMQERGIALIDLFTFTRNLGPDVYADHVHFTAKVRAQQAAFIAGHLFARIT
jgi:lysophospholipase L1-like esterase